MVHSLTPTQHQFIEQTLPTEIAALCDHYPNTIYEVASAWHYPELPVGYLPNLIEVYYSNDDGADAADLTIEQGHLTRVRLPIDDTTCDVIQIEVDGHWAFIQINSQIVLDRLSGRVVLPEVLLDAAQLAASFIHAIA
jgi:hypothetical protein